MKSAMLLFLGLGVAACGSVSGDKTPDAKTIDSPTIDTATIDSVPAFSPSQLTGLALWLDADKGVTAGAGNKVSVWADQSPRGNNASQTVAARQPTVATGVVNGHPVIRFDGTANVLVVPDAQTLQFGMEDFTIAVVGSWTNVQSAYAAFLTKQIEPTYPYLGYSVWANFPQPAPSTKFGFQIDAATDFATTAAASLNDGAPRLYVSKRAGTAMEIRVGGAADGSFTATSIKNVSATGYKLSVGGHESADGASVIQLLKGDIAEIVIVRGALSTTDLQKLETYLKTKYGL
jgi:hypothetical protein